MEADDLRAARELRFTLSIMAPDRTHPIAEAAKLIDRLLAERLMIGEAIDSSASRKMVFDHICQTLGVVDVYRDGRVHDLRTKALPPSPLWERINQELADANRESLYAARLRELSDAANPEHPDDPADPR